MDGIKLGESACSYMIIKKLLYSKLVITNFSFRDDRYYKGNCCDRHIFGPRPIQRPTVFGMSTMSTC